jgi:hypothetical protein
MSLISIGLLLPGSVLSEAACPACSGEHSIPEYNL